MKRTELRKIIFLYLSVEAWTHFQLSNIKLTAAWISKGPGGTLGFDESTSEVQQLFQWGVQAERDGNLEMAEQLYRRVLETNQLALQIHSSLARLCKRNHNISGALYHYSFLLLFIEHAEQRTAQATVFNHIGLLEREQADKDPLGIIKFALPFYDKAIELFPESINAIYNKGGALQTVGETLEAIHCFRLVLEKIPNHVGANMNVGNFFLRLRLFSEAEIFYKRALKYSSPQERLSCYTNLGQLYREWGKVSKAVAMFELGAGTEESFSCALFYALVSNRNTCNWRKFSYRHAIVLRELARQQDWTCLTPYETLLLPGNDMFHGTKEPKSRVETYMSSLDDMRKLDLSAVQSTCHSTKLRIGYLSYDMNDHPMGYLTYGLFLHHQRTMFTVHVYSYGSGTGSRQRQRIIEASDRFIDLAVQSDVQAASRIAGDCIDILYDLMAHTRGTRLGIISLKPAPIIVNYLGYPGTSGFSNQTVDYLMGDRYILPYEVTKEQVSEKVIHLPHFYQANAFNLTQDFCDLSSEENYEASCRETLRRARALQLHGLSEQEAVVYLDRQFVFANFNTITKVDPHSFNSWMKILQKVEQSVLLLLLPSIQEFHMVQKNLRREAVLAQVDPDRLAFVTRVPKTQHIDRVRCIDLFLDTFTYGAHSTASDVLFAGTPMVTIKGNMFSNRVGYSLLRNLRLNSLIAYEEKDYETLAVFFATTSSICYRLRKEIAKSILITPTYQSKSLTFYHELASKAIFDIRRAGLPNKHLMIDASGSHDKDFNEDYTVSALRQSVSLQSRSSKKAALNIVRRLLHLPDAVEVLNKKKIGEFHARAGSTDILPLLYYTGESNQLYALL